MWAERRALWLGSALAVSLAANLFLGGALAGRVAFPGEPPQAQPVTRAAMQARFQTLHEADRAPFRDAMRQYGTGLPDARRALRQVQLQTLGSLRATPYDKAAVQQAFTALRAANQAYQLALHGALAEAFATLSPSARAEVLGPRR